MWDWLRSLLCPDVVKLLEKIEQLEFEYAELIRNYETLEDKVSILIDSIAANLTVPPCTEFTYIDDAETYYPFGDVVLKLYQTAIADASYYSFPKEQWIALLSIIQPIIKKIIGKWTTDIADCDDFALVMNSYVAISFIKAGYPKQGAFFTLWSPSHAYNGFRDNGGNIWIYEPQNDKVIGKLGQTVSPYDTKKVWAPGVEL